MMGKKYIIWPGYVTSRRDGDRNYITAAQLMHLYRVPQQNCVLAPPPDDRSLQAKIKRKQLTGIKGLVHLTPRSDGNYTLPAND